MTSEQLLLELTLNAWKGQLKRADQLFAGFTDEQLQAEIAPGKNSGQYLLGHLTATHDRLFELLDLGARLHPELDAPFLSNPDKSGLPQPTVAELRQYWSDVNAKLADHLAKLLPSEWLQRHTQVSPEDFKKEPHRNKLNVLISRTNHVAYHLGQLVWLRK
ncbi:DinB family protein [Chryseolinea lacunae]|uniref:DinB family protein n=1 Tax=Chryseolinea lacunae TaxID=2801331 RepID=A0ABS1KLE0_9BACT|nr:DinB family protein [Chryseolinea lacunae]MBL0740042.1 DinB family protein [Chryseolinea lacunae]